MTRLLLALLFLWQIIARPDPRYEQYQRSLQLPRATRPAPGQQVCASLDGLVYAHSQPDLRDLRLYQNRREVPYAITLSESSEPETLAARVFNLGARGNSIVFDLQMPDRPYTDVDLALAAHNFIATAEVSGSNPGTPSTRLGTFTLFDLSAQHLSRSTSLPLEESRFATLHVTLHLAPAPGTAAPARFLPSLVQGASVPPSRESQILYTTVAETSTISQRGPETVARFHLPAHVPVERIAFVLAPGYTGNFSRGIRILARAEDTPNAILESLSGNILRVRMDEIRQQILTVPATLGSNLQHDAEVEVLVENGDDTPLPITQVLLQMRERRLCFSPGAAGPLTLFYGDPSLAAPIYDYGRLFSTARPIAAATLGPEQRNPAFIPRPRPERPLTERHPELLWIALLISVCSLAVVALHSARRMQQ